ncbi:MAG: hypothetical protein ACOC8E_06420, partial [Planctomycetota bacterium]
MSIKTLSVISSGFAAFVLCAGAGSALEANRLKVQRADVFEFAERPAVTVDGDRVTITFRAKDYCDATVAIESAIETVGGRPKIVRHLASGVLGKNAPAPFRKNTLRQLILRRRRRTGRRNRPAACAARDPRPGLGPPRPLATPHPAHGRIALDIVRMARQNSYDVALVFSQDQDLSEVADEVRRISEEQDRWIKVACAYPFSPTYDNRRGINRTDWIKIDRATYDKCLDPNDYRPKTERGTTP